MRTITNRRGERVIRLPHRVIAVLLAVFAAIMLAGCSTGIGVSGDKDLKGARTTGNDSYTGVYQADYDKFTGEETVFGGTGKETSIHLTGTIENMSGIGKSLWPTAATRSEPCPSRMAQSIRPMTSKAPASMST